MTDFVAIDFETANGRRSSVWADTLCESRRRWPGIPHNLDVIAERCGYDLTNHHHALADAEACAWIAREIL